MGRIGIYLGSRNDDVSNINNVLDTWVEYLLKANHKIDLVGGQNVPEFSQGRVVQRKVADTGSRTPFGKIRGSYSHVSQYCSKYEPDAVIQLWKYQTHGISVALAGKRNGVPTVVRLTGDVFKEYRGFEFPYSAGVYVLNNMLGMMTLHSASKVVVLGPRLEEAARSRGLDEKDIYLIPPPQPDEERFYPNEGGSRNLPGVDPDRPIALFVGRLTEQKGMGFLEQVIKSALTKTDLQFVLVGDGPYRERLQQRFSSKQVMLPGHVPHEEIPEYYRAATVYVHPSPFEGIPLVILEALQSDTPVIARDAGDIAFVVDDVVQNVDEMVKRLVDGGWNTTWKNRGYFTPSYHQDEITRLISEALNS